MKPRMLVGRSGVVLALLLLVVVVVVAVLLLVVVVLLLLILVVVVVVVVLLLHAQFAKSRELAGLPPEPALATRISEGRLYIILIL